MLKSLLVLAFLASIAAVFKFATLNYQSPRLRGKPEPEISSAYLLLPLAVLSAAAVASRARRKTKTVMIGKVPVGSDHQLTLQSMTTTPTADVKGTAAQVLKCRDAGIDIVRVTVQGMKEAKACMQLREQVGDIPIVADIHFTPRVAVAVAGVVDKVRINPGNFADGAKTFNTLNG